MKNRRKLYAALALLGGFLFWTIAVCLVDVQAIGPNGSAVGFAAVNGTFHRLTGVHLPLYVLTDWLSLIPVGIAVGFALLGAVQWIRRKKLRHVDFNILALGGFYVLLAAAYLFFECVVINYRPVLIEGVLEASYPSSTTLLVLCVMGTAMLQFKERIQQKTLRKWVLILCAAFTIFMVVCRVISGVHWLSDIVGGVLLSSALIQLYRFLCAFQKK